MIPETDNNVLSTETLKRHQVLILLVILAFGACLRFMHIHGPLGGYHSMNEAWYIGMAHNFDNVSLLTPTSSQGDVDSKVRALYVYTVYAASKVFGDSHSVARSVSAVSGLAAILFIFFIGKRLQGIHCGLIGAALLSATPIHVIVSRNAQPDAMCVSLTLLSLLIYLESNNKSNLRMLALAGLVWGAAVFTKNFALLLLPAVLFHELVQKQPMSQTAIRTACFMGPALALPLPFLVFQLMRNPMSVINFYRDIVLRIPGGETLRYMMSETLWALSPVIAGLALAGILWIPFRNFRSHALVWSAALIFSAQYLFQHVHSYYFLSATPFLVLCAAVVLASLPVKSRTGIATLALISSVILSVLCYAAVKHRYDRFPIAAAIIHEHSPTGTVIAPGSIINNYGPVLHHYMTGYEIVRQDTVPLNPDTGLFKLDSPRPWFLMDFVRPGQNDSLSDPRFENMVAHSLQGFQMGTRVYYSLPRGPHSFIPLQLGAFQATDNKFRVGFAEYRKYNTLRISRVPDGKRIYLVRNEQGGNSFVFKPE